MEERMKNQEWRIVLLSSFVVVIFCAFLNFIFDENLENQGVFFVYLFCFTLLPLIIFGIERWSGFFTKNQGVTISGWVALLFNAWFCAQMAAYPDVLNLSVGIFTVMMAYFFLMILRKALFNHNTTEISMTPIITIMANAAIAEIVLLGFWNTFVEGMWFDPFDGIASEISHWWGWPAVMVGIFGLFTGYVLWGAKTKNITKDSFWTILVCFAPILLFSIQGTFDIDHYDAFIGPAIAVLHGQIPLVDVFSQYGLGYLVFTLAFLVLPNTYGVCAAIVSLMNVAVFVVYLLILRILIRNPYQFTLVGIISTLGLYFSNTLSVNIFPSALGFRYLPTMLFVFFLVSGNFSEKNRLKKPVNLIFLCLNALWSLECLYFYFAIAAFYRWLMTYSIKAVFFSTFQLFCKLLLASVVFLCFYFMLFKQFPQYWVYIEHPISYLTGRHDGGSFTQKVETLGSRFLFFVPMAILATTCFYYSIFIDRKNKVSPVLYNLYLINFSGIVFFVYLSLHSFVYHVKMEWVLFFSSFLGTLFFVKEESKHFIFRFLATSVVWLTCLVFFCVIMSRVFYVLPSNTGTSDALIYNVVHFKKETFANFWHNINNFCNRLNYKKERSSRALFYALPSSCKKYDFHEEMKSVVEKYYKERDSMLIFSISALEILFENNKYHPIFVNPMNDISVDETQSGIIKRKLKSIKNGDVVVIDKDVGLDTFQKSIIRTIWKKFGFELIEETPHLLVFRLSNLVSNKSPWFLSLSNFSSYIGKNGVVNYDMPLNVMNINMKNYFYWGDVLSIEVDYHRIFNLQAVKLWNLISTKDILRHRFFFNNQIKNFSVLVSEDKKNWQIVVSEKGYFMNDKKYYYKRFYPLKARYLRLNVFVDDPNTLFPIIEVFGEDINE
jgi:hypothetical protein